MNNSYIKIILFILINTFIFSVENFAQSDTNEKHIEVSMRMIGHEILLSLGDSISQILPIEKIDDRYKIQFGTDFKFVPDSLVKTIDQVIKKAKIEKDYIVEVENCESKKVVYSYEIGLLLNNSSMIPCKERSYPANCYNIFITLLDKELIADKNASKQESNSGYTFSFLKWLGLLLLIPLGYFFFFRQKDEPEIDDPNKISIGAYQFNKKNMSLSYQDTTIDLTQKEADLLNLLHNFANQTIERDIILQKVWGDEGDYIGRTLDVFISKLRKKIEADESLKIVNIRGVGYKLVID